MPLYEYLCENCGLIEIQQSIKDQQIKTCPKCGNLNFKKLISLSSFHLKGSGWYKTEYKSENKKKDKEPKKTS